MGNGEKQGQETVLLFEGCGAHPWLTDPEGSVGTLLLSGTTVKLSDPVNPEYMIINKEYTNTFACFDVVAHFYYLIETLCDIVYTFEEFVRTNREYLTCKVPLGDCTKRYNHLLLELSRVCFRCVELIHTGVLQFPENQQRLLMDNLLFLVSSAPGAHGALVCVGSGDSGNNVVFYEDKVTKHTYSLLSTLSRVTQNTVETLLRGSVVLSKLPLTTKNNSLVAQWDGVLSVQGLLCVLNRAEGKVGGYVSSSVSWSVFHHLVTHLSQSMGLLPRYLPPTADPVSVWSRAFVEKYISDAEAAQSSVAQGHGVGVQQGDGVAGEGQPTAPPPTGNPE